jgi:undecaprenyl-phosphate 4-deoxy-4-formamido-L-arabinose transferase
MVADVTVVAAVYNNARTLPELCRRLRATLGPRLAAILLVDDGSTDDSRAVMATLDVTAIARPRNGGQSAAILDGLTAAATPITCVLDADLEDPPEALPDLIARLGQGDARVVFSSREEARPLSSRVFRRAMRAIFPTLPAHPCLCFAIDDRTRRQVLALATEGDYVVGLIGAVGVPTAQVTVQRGVRPAGPSGYSPATRIGYATRMLWSALALRTRQRARVAHARQKRDTR